MGSNTSRDLGNNASSSSSSSRRQNGRPTKAKQTTIQEYVDYGTTLPNGLYTAQQDYNIKNVRRLIRLSDPPEPQQSEKVSSELPPSPPTLTNSRPRKNSSLQQQQQQQIEDQRKKTLYNNPVECPICFLYYPSNINHSRCCDQPICTECFLQIKRPIETPSLPAACPFCMEDNFGVIYEAPAWSSGRPRSPSSSSPAPTNNRPSSKVSPRHTTSGVSDGMIPRRKSINHNDPDVVLVDHVRPDWREAPVRTGRSRHNSESRGSNNDNGFFRTASPLFTRPGRSASSAAHSEYHHYLTAMRDRNMDLEDYFVMEAIRMSLADQEQLQQRQREQEQQQEENRSAEGDGDGGNEQQQEHQQQSPPSTDSNTTPLITTTAATSNNSST
ncbi:hypothetical protein BDB00DRAFT_879466 [Zychaea mexicana]|uniref:uncharacterized protein n=1 Tax=Zychaea mexicana TaxID=64656 RepID=UPI0022FEB289|nr:uncharacterized protein BDB00DRAFT_879466 [Zychaea mexicana]KAI9477148.1 hypothetical protein BDB00DRAFT_879466 [Zychaea mexicana]